MFDQDQLDAMGKIADMAIASGFTKYRYDNTGRAQARFVIMKGAELGLQPIAALSGIYVIGNQVTVSPHTMLGLIQGTGELEDLIINATETECIVTITRRGHTPHVERFTIQDASKLGLAKKDNYQKQPKTMLKWRAISAAARVIFADVLHKIYLQEEIDTDATIEELGEDYFEEAPIDLDTVEEIPFKESEPVQQPEEAPATSQFEGSAELANAKSEMTFRILASGKFTTKEEIAAAIRENELLYNMAQALDTLPMVEAHLMGDAELEQAETK